MAVVSSGVSLSTNYFMNNFYASNRSVIKTSGRSDYTKLELSYEDSRALTRAAKDHDTKYQLKKMKAFLSKHSDDLEHIGVSLESSGKLSINEDLLKSAKNSKVRKIFSADQEFSKQFYKMSKKAHAAVEGDIYSQINGKGLHVNISL